MRSKLTVITCLLFISCNFFKRSPEDRYRDKMENATDEELMNEIIGKPLMYEVVSYNYTAKIKRKSDGKTIWSSSQFNGYPFYRNAQLGGLLPTSGDEGDRLGYETLGLSSGAILQVIFTKGSVYIEKFGRLNGSYEQGTYANADGTLKLKFGESFRDYDSSSPTTIGGSEFIQLNELDQIRNNPVRNCELLGIRFYHTSEVDGKKVVVHYFLKSLTRPGYFHKESNEK